MFVKNLMQQNFSTSKHCIQTWITRKILKRDPNLKSFLHQKKSIVVDVVIAAILKLVVREASSCTSSLSDEFSLIIEEDGVYKSYSL